MRTRNFRVQTRKFSFPSHSNEQFLRRNEKIFYKSKIQQNGRLLNDIKVDCKRVSIVDILIIFDRALCQLSRLKFGP